MKLINKLIIFFLITLSLTLTISCSKYLGVKVDLVNGSSNIQQEEKTQENLYNTIEDTQISLDKTGVRLIGTDGNYSFVSELKQYFEKFSGVEVVSFPYSINLPSEYAVTITTDAEEIYFDSSNSICKFINEGKLSDAVIITDTLEKLDKSLRYVFITTDENLIEVSKEYQNVILSILSVDKIFLGQNSIKVRNTIPTIMNVDKSTAEKLLGLKNQKAELTINSVSKEIELENVYAVIKGKESNDAIVITSHIDTTTALGNNYSKGAIDNGSGISLNLDIFRNLYEHKNNSNYDVIFAFVNSEEGFLTRSLSGSMQLSASLSFKYENVININLDCLGEKNIDLLSYGFDGNINENKVTNIINSQDVGKFKLEKADYYTSDNLSFVNAIYFYNFDYHGANRAIHTERDTIELIDIQSLESISKIVFNVLIELMNLSSEELLVN